MDLTLHDEWIDDTPEVVHCRVALDAHDAGLGVDLQFAYVTTRGKGEVLGIVEGGLFQARFQLLQRVVVRHIGRHGDVAESFGYIRTGHRELTVLELDVRLGGFQQVGGDLGGLGHHFLQGVHDGYTTDGQGA